MDMICLTIKSQKLASVLYLIALESFPNNKKRTTVTSPPVNSFAGSTYPLSTTDNIFDGLLSPFTSPDNDVDVDDWDDFGPDNNSDGSIGDTSMYDDSGAN